MIAAPNRPHRLLAVVALLSIAVAFLSSGCLWGVVKDANTGAPLPGVSVSYSDSKGHTGSTTTNARGWYAFDVAKGPVPAAGLVWFQLSPPGYQPLSAPRLVEYNDNPKASLSNPSSFWEVQHFNLLPLAGPALPWPTATPALPPGGGEWGIITADLVVSDIFPMALPEGWLWARITNLGPDAVTGVVVELECEVFFEVLTYPNADMVRTSVPVSLDVGQTGAFPLGYYIWLNAVDGFYEITCWVEAPFNDPNPGSTDKYCERIGYGEPICTES